MSNTHLVRAVLSIAGAAVLLVASGCGGGGTAANTGGSTASVPTTLPSGATLGCVEAPSDSCAYGGAAAAPAGLKAVAVGTKITPSMFKLQDPFVIDTDSSAPGGTYIALPPGTGSTSTPTGEADAAVTIAQDGYYVIWAATQSGDTTTGTDSFFLGFDGNLPTADVDHLWSINPDNTWHAQDSSGGCVQIVHAGTNDAPNGCDTWHFKKGVLVINLMGREAQTNVAWMEVAPANPSNPMGDAR